MQLQRCLRPLRDISPADFGIWLPNNTRSGSERSCKLKLPAEGKRGKPHWRPGSGNTGGIGTSQLALLHARGLLLAHKHDVGRWHTLMLQLAPAKQRAACWPEARGRVSRSFCASPGILTGCKDLLGRHFLKTQQKC